MLPIPWLNQAIRGVLSSFHKRTAFHMALLQHFYQEWFAILAFPKLQDRPGDWPWQDRHQLH